MDARTDRPPQAGEWLSPEASRTQARPLRAWSAARQAVVRDACQAAYGAWCRDWGLVEAPVQVVEAAMAPGALGCAAASQVLRGWLFGDAPASGAAEGPDMAADIAAQAWSALQSALAGLAPEARESRDAAEAPAAWSGALAVLFPWGGKSWAWRLDGDCVQALLGRHEPPSSGCAARTGQGPATPRAALAPLDQALRGHRVAMHIHLQPLTLSLGQLQSLAVGDVIALDHPLAAPAAARLSAGGREPAKPLCAAWLGQSGGHLAVELHPEAS
ncbi:FliM/FliN family flagellar motor switch protein [Acidovorax sacchari]|uniref:FliM/FliN family flagellar motor switch protein n=1 Tax=Acidovorax sacchari TaxID=3230736 RepID=UPI0039E45634